VGAVTHAAWIQVRSRRWYGATGAWWAPFERDARRQYGDDLRVDLALDKVTYRVDLEVRGLIEPVPVRIVFFADPPYDTYSLAPEDYPRVWADADDTSPHRMPDRSLCLYYPQDPIDRRWHSGLGLNSLLNLICDHVFFEHYWRSTGGHHHGVWLGPEAGHGLPEGRIR
jgi:hypothetical protein